jgi:ATP-dependent protease ClpP protease subunit
MLDASDLPDQEEPVAAPALPQHYYWTFGGPITEPSVARFINVLPTMMQAPATATHHLSLQSSGGHVGDGIWLYNFLKVFPRKLIVYNTGTLASIAAIAYLGGQHRKTSAHAAFMLHRTTYHPLRPTTTNLAVATKILAIEDARTEALLRERARLTDEHWRHLEHHDLWLTAQEAVAVGVADEIGEFTPRHGGELLMI